MSIPETAISAAASRAPKEAGVIRHFLEKRKQKQETHKKFRADGVGTQADNRVTGPTAG